MGVLHNKNLPQPLPCFCAVEIACSLKVDWQRTVSLRHVLLLHNDKETVEFVEMNIAGFVHNVKMMEKMAVLPEAELPSCLPSEIKPLFESIALDQHSNILPNLTASLKKAILSLAMIRFNGDRELICTVLGLSSSQYEEELQLAGLC